MLKRFAWWKDISPTAMGLFFVGISNQGLLLFFNVLRVRFVLVGRRVGCAYNAAGYSANGCCAGMSFPIMIVQLILSLKGLIADRTFMQLNCLRHECPSNLQRSKERARQPRPSG